MFIGMLFLAADAVDMRRLIASATRAGRGAMGADEGLEITEIAEFGHQSERLRKASRSFRLGGAFMRELIAEHGRSGSPKGRVFFILFEKTKKPDLPHQPLHDKTMTVGRMN